MSSDWIVKMLNNEYSVAEAIFCIQSCSPLCWLMGVCPLYTKGMFIWEKVIPVSEKTFRLAN